MTDTWRQAGLASSMKYARLAARRKREAEEAQRQENGSVEEAETTNDSVN